jgi:hypothetical protein
MGGARIGGNLVDSPHGARPNWVSMPFNVSMTLDIGQVHVLEEGEEGGEEGGEGEGEGGRGRGRQGVVEEEHGDESDSSEDADENAEGGDAADDAEQEEEMEHVTSDEEGKPF